MWSRRVTFSARHQRIEIQTRGASGTTVTWTTRATRCGKLEMVTGTEQIEAAKLVAGLLGRVRFGYDSTTAGITPTDRLKYGTRVFHVRSAVNVDERSREVEVTVVEQVS